MSILGIFFAAAIVILHLSAAQGQEILQLLPEGRIETYGQIGQAPGSSLLRVAAAETISVSDGANESETTVPAVLSVDPLTRQFSIARIPSPPPESGLMPNDRALNVGRNGAFAVGYMVDWENF